jgi:hypothetical protein
MDTNEHEGNAWTQLRQHWDEASAKEPDYRSPEERALLDAMFKQFDGLRELGWQEAVYCPKDGSVFLAIEAGSTGVHECHYQGEWPKGSWWTHAAGDLWPSHPILWKPLPKGGTTNGRE